MSGGFKTESTLLMTKNGEELLLDLDRSTGFDLFEYDTGNPIRKTDTAVAGGIALDVFAGMEPDTGAGQSHPVLQRRSDELDPFP